MFKVCIISCGMITNAAHIPAYRQFSEDFEIVAVCDINEKSAEISGIHCCCSHFPGQYGKIRNISSGKRRSRHVFHRRSLSFGHFRNRFGTLPATSGLIRQFFSRTEHSQTDEYSSQKQLRIRKGRKNSQRRTEIQHSASIDYNSLLPHAAVTQAAVFGQAYHLA